MGDDNKEQAGNVTKRREQVYDWAGTERDRVSGSQTPFEQEYIPISQGMYNDYRSAADRSQAHYGDILGGYRDWREKSVTPLIADINAREAPKFSFREVGYDRDPDTIGKAISGYSEFADTGGYSPTDIQELRARGVSPIRAAYGNAMRNVDRQRSLQGGYSPNYTAATASMQRQLPQQLADATTSVNAELANAIRSGRLAGMSGLTGIGGMEAGHKMQAGLANQGADLQAQNLTEQGRSAKEARQLAAQNLMFQGIDAERQLYGTTPAAAATFGDQASRAYGQRSQMEQLRNQYGLGLSDLQLQSLGQQKAPGTPWWKTALDYGMAAAPYVAMAASSKELKEDIEPLSDKEIHSKLKTLPLFSWKYKGDKTKHVGPMAEDFKEIFGVGDGKTLHLADVMGVTLASARHRARGQHA